jgi:hypothetical protein
MTQAIADKPKPPPPTKAQRMDRLKRRFSKLVRQIGTVSRAKTVYQAEQLAEALTELLEPEEGAGDRGIGNAGGMKPL